MNSNIAKGFIKTAGFGSSISKILSKAKTPVAKGAGAAGSALGTVGKTLGKYKDFAINTLGMSAGMGIPFALHDHFTSDDGKSLGSRVYDETKSMIPYNILFGALDKKYRIRKAFGKGGIAKYIKELKMFSGDKPLVALKKTRRYKWPAIGAVAGGALNYDPENPVSSAAKGAAGGALMMSPKMFKTQKQHGVAHGFVDEIVDGPAFLMMGPAIMAGAKRFGRYQTDKTRERQNQEVRRRIKRMRPVMGAISQGPIYPDPSSGAF